VDTDVRGEGSSRQMIVTIGLAALVVVSLGVGFLAGYLTGGGRIAASQVVTTGPGATGGNPQAPGQQASPGQPAIQGHSVGPGGTVTCVYDLAAKDQWILSGLTCICKEPNCNRTPLLACHCDNAHAMKALTKQMIVEGKSSEQIGAELEKRYGPGVLPAGGAPHPPSPQAVKP